MTDIDIRAKSDRELLIMLVDKVNTTCKLVENHDKWINGNGLPGAKLKMWLMWAVFVAIAIKIF